MTFAYFLKVKDLNWDLPILGSNRSGAICTSKDSNRYLPKMVNIHSCLKCKLKYPDLSCRFATTCMATAVELLLSCLQDNRFYFYRCTDSLLTLSGLLQKRARIWSVRRESSWLPAGYRIYVSAICSSRPRWRESTRSVVVTVSRTKMVSESNRCLESVLLGMSGLFMTHELRITSTQNIGYNLQILMVFFFVSAGSKSLFWPWTPHFSVLLYSHCQDRFWINFIAISVLFRAWTDGVGKQLYCLHGAVVMWNPFCPP